MKRFAYSVTAIFLLLTGLFFTLWRLVEETMLFPAVVCATVLYHAGMRLFVGLVTGHGFRPDSPWFSEKPFEKALYRKLRVKKWKAKMPTYSPQTYAVASLPPETIAKTMCRNEVVHELCAVFSLLPILLGFSFGAWWFFVPTSVFGFFADLAFAAIQRYNRPRILRLVRRRQGKGS